MNRVLMQLRARVGRRRWLERTLIQQYDRIVDLEQQVRDLDRCGPCKDGRHSECTGSCAGWCCYLDWCETEIERHVELWPLAKVLVETRPGSKSGNWTWENELAELMNDPHHRPIVNTLAEDIRTNGQQDPITVGWDGRIWDGHHRVAAAVVLGGHYVMVRRVPRPSASDPAGRANGTIGAPPGSRGRPGRQPAAMPGRRTRRDEASAS